MDIFSLLRVYAVMAALGTLGMAALLMIRRVKPGIREDGALRKKWKRSFTISAALTVISVFMTWRSIYRYDERTLVLENSALFNSMFYYGNGRLCIDSYFLLQLFMVMIAMQAVAVSLED